MGNLIEIIARAFIVKNGEVLLCKVKSKNNYFFPGGHVENGENIEEALRREFKEEIGLDISQVILCGILENTFSDERGEHQEINVVFEAQMDSYEFSVLEDHMEFGWFGLEKIASMNVLPEKMKDQFLLWLEEKKIFYIK